MATTTPTPAEVSTTRASPAQLYCWIWGAMLVVLGGGSLLLHPDFSTGDEVTPEHLFGVFETNGWHGVAGLSAGILALVAAPSRKWAPPATAFVGIAGGVVPALLFFAVGSDSNALGLIPVDMVGAVFLHLLPGVLGAVCAVWRRP